MATRTVHIDDLTGEEGADTVTIAIDGSSWSIDLAAGSRTKLDKALKPFLDAATSLSTRRAGLGRGSAAKAGRTPQELQVIREWARANGHEVSDRGRIPNAIMEEYDSGR